MNYDPYTNPVRLAHNLREAIKISVFRAARQISKEMEDSAHRQDLTEQRISEIFHSYLNDQIVKRFWGELDSFTSRGVKDIAI